MEDCHVVLGGVAHLAQLVDNLGLVVGVNDVVPLKHEPGADDVLPGLAVLQGERC